MISNCNIKHVLHCSCLKEAYKIQTGRELELHDVPRFLRSILESVFVGNSFVFRFSSCEGGVRLSDLLNQQSGQGEVQPLTTCGLNALGSHPSRTVLSALKSTFPVLQKLLLLPPSPILPPLHHIKCEEESASFTLCGSPNDEGLSVQSGVELESISGASGLVPSNSPGNPFSDYSLLHMPSVNLGSLFTPPFDTSLDPCGHPCVDDCSTPKPTSASFLVLSQRAWRDFEHSSVRSSDLASKPLLHVGRNIPGSSPCASSTFIKDGDLASSKTSPELFSEPRPHVQQSAGHYKTPCASSKNLRRRILSQLDNSISQNKVDLRGASSRSPDLFTP